MEEADAKQDAAKGEEQKVISTSTAQAAERSKDTDSGSKIYPEGENESGRSSMLPLSPSLLLSAACAVKVGIVFCSSRFATFCVAPASSMRARRRFLHSPC